MTGAGANRILGSYQLGERVGKGGMGEVYRARHTRLGNERAVKVLPASLAAEEDFLKRFEREAASVARLDHPHILAVYDYGEADGVPYLVMPFVGGGTLKERLARGPIPREEILDYIRQAGEALDYAHEQGIIHRDVKPANLLLDGRGRLYLADFGIAKALEGAEGLTRTGVGVGTPEYMAPEQAQGRADQRSDLYALGVVLYQLLTGRVPFSGNSTVEVLMKHLQDPLPVLPLRAAAPALPPGVERVVAKALAKNPNDRYPTAKALVDDLREALAAGPYTQAADATIVATPQPQFGGNTAAPVTPLPAWQNPANTGQATFAGASGPSTFGNLPPVPPVPPQSGPNRGLIFGVVGALVVLLLVCVGGVAVFAARLGSPTPTIAAQGPTVTPARAAGAAITPSATTAPPSTAASASPSPAPSPSSSSLPLFPSTSPAPSASARPSAAPSPSPTPRPSAATGSRAPLGQAPAGWKTYSGNAKVPFAMYYPSDWRVDETHANDGFIQIYPPGDNEVLLLIGTTGIRAASSDPNFLRDEYFQTTIKGANPEAVSDTPDTETLSGITFSTLGANHNGTKVPVYTYFGVGLNQGIPWRFRIIDTTSDFSNTLNQYFAPMLLSLNIYANP